MAWKSYVLFSAIYLALFFPQLHVQAQQSGFHFHLQTEQDTFGQKTGTLQIQSLGQIAQEEFTVIYEYSGFTVDTASVFSFIPGPILEGVSWTDSVEHKPLLNEIHVIMHIHSDDLPLYSGELFRLGGIVVEIEESIFRQAASRDFKLIPKGDQLVIDNLVATPIERIEILDLHGQTILQTFPTESVYTVDMISNGIAHGYYVLRVWREGRLSQTKFKYGF
ncbi:MAG: hypothetical protein AAFW00_04065 [Bacteroidota bacterium]